MPVTRSFHGDDYVDNYEWLRDEANPAVVSHIRAENAWFEARTEHLGDLREQIVGEMASHTKETDVGAPARNGDYWYWTRTWEGASYPAYFRAAALADNPPDPDQVSETEVYNGNDLARHHEYFAIGSRAISPDGRLCALAIDYAGDEEFKLRIHDIDADVVVDDVLGGINYGLIWSQDSKRIYYTRADDAWRCFQVWVHTVGTPPHDDELLFQEDDPLYSIEIDNSRDGQWVVVSSQSRTTSEVRLISTSNPHHHIVVCPRRKDLDYSVEVAGDDLLIIHNHTNPGFDLARAPLGESVPDQWETLISADSDERITEVAAFKDFAAILMRSGGLPQLRAIQRTEEKSGERGWSEPVVVPTEELATVELWANHVWDTSEVAFTIDSLLTPLTFQTWNVDTGDVATRKATEVPNYDRSRYTMYRDWAVADDGTRIPLTVAHRSDLGRDGQNPGLMEGYGSYEVSNDAWFLEERFPILDRGIVYVVAHVRGGGEMGRAWYEDGKFLSKRNTFTDFIACAAHVIDTGLVQPDRLAAEGASAGGLLMGAVANMAPEKFRVIHANVPFVDALTTILKPDLPLTIGEWEEWGNPIADHEVYAYMKSYSPCENLAECEYPAILATTSMNDVRVSYVEPTKWVQLLREKSTNDPMERPILQFTELVAGHGGGSGRYERWKTRANQLAFIFDQLGVA